MMTGESCKHGWIDPQFNMSFGMWTRVGPKEACIRLECTLAQPGEYNSTVHFRRRCGLMTNYFDHIIIISIIIIIIITCYITDLI